MGDHLVHECCDRVCVDILDLHVVVHLAINCIHALGERRRGGTTNKVQARALAAGGLVVTSPPGAAALVKTAPQGGTVQSFHTSTCCTSDHDLATHLVVDVAEVDE